MSCYHSFKFVGTPEELQSELEQIEAAMCSVDLFDGDPLEGTVIGFWSNERLSSSIHNLTGADLTIMEAQGD